MAVLPFENLGAAEDGYFADGMTDEVRSKLAGLSGLAVIASASASQYKGTTKPLEQIANELGVGYLLVAKVRWQKSGQASRIRLTSELVEQAYQIFIHARPYQKREALLAFARSKGLISENIAAHALLVRAYQLADIRADGFDVEADLPEIYEAITTGRITAEDLGSSEMVFEPARDDEPELPLH